MRIRAHTGFDAEATLRVFLRAVRQIASRDYSPKQIAAWAPDGINLDAWTAKREAVNTVVATVDGRVIGFTDLDETGYIDMMFVDPDFTQRGVASALMTWIVEGAHECGIVELSSHVSLTARSFFEHNGFVVHEERHPILRRVEMTNFLMRRVLHSVPARLGNVCFAAARSDLRSCSSAMHSETPCQGARKTWRERADRRTLSGTSPLTVPWTRGIRDF